ncbi:hypothetical protein GO013_12575 [Pseudodesulfovibrio sp. JC047]|uniref:hypothetical protein n=1 Tax=Pseudodesulfovibrio sp. JC047 TaxID=2683199 RepID=UPI0013D626EB|nr:hypothetical protein [Pseudodesulfovibrio sp. JC047]NDV20246.1 hypothetical protein [Pseudodesulfovibrio sp. JC047]
MALLIFFKTVYIDNKYKNLIWMGTAAGLVGTTFWELAAHDIPVANILVPFSVALGGLISDFLIWQLLVEKGIQDT